VSPKRARLLPFTSGAEGGSLSGEHLPRCQNGEAAFPAGLPIDEVALQLK